MRELTDRERDGNHALMKHYYGDGRWGRSGSGLLSVQGGVEVHKYRPRVVPRWEVGTGRNAHKVHAVRYRLTAVEQSSGEVLRRLTAWLCGAHSYSETRRVQDPEEVCARCLAVLEGTASGTTQMPPRG